MLRAIACGCTMMFALLHWAALSQAATIYLKSGKKVEGTFVKRTQDVIYVGSSEEHSVPYWIGEVERVEGAELTLPDASSEPSLPSGPVKSTNSAEPGWNEFVSMKGGFHVLLPGHPTEPAPPTETTGTVIAKEGGFSCVAGYVTIPQMIYNLAPPELRLSISKMLKDTKEGALQSGFQLVSERELSLDGHPGFELALRSEEFPTWVLRRYVVGQRSYDLVATMTTEGDHSVETSKFFDSFSFVTQ